MIAVQALERRTAELKTERGAACGAGIKGRRARSEARLL